MQAQGQFQLTLHGVLEPEEAFRGVPSEAKMAGPLVFAHEAVIGCEKGTDLG